MEALRQRIDDLNDLAWSLRRSDRKQAKALSEEAFSLSHSDIFGDSPYTLGIADSLRTQGQVATHDGNYTKAIALADGALHTYESIKHDEGIIQALFIYCFAYLPLSEFTKLLEYALRTLKVAQKIDNRHATALAYNFIGVVYSSQKEPAKALESFKQALAIAQEIGDIVLQAAGQINLGNEYANLKDYKAGIASQQRAIELFAQVDNTNDILLAYSNMGQNYLKLGDYQAAREALTQSLHYGEMTTLEYRKIPPLRMFGELELREGNFAEAQTYLLQALEIAEKNNNARQQYLCYDLLSESYEKSGNLAQALHYYKRFHEVKESVYNDENNKRLRNLEILHRTQQLQDDADRQRTLREQDQQHFDRLTQIKDDFISMASHDLKNPLASLSLNVELLERYGLLNDERGIKLAARMRNNIEKMRDLITGLLDLARLDTGLALSTQKAQLDELLQSSVEDFQLKATEKNITLDLATPLSEAMVNIDMLQMRRVMDNLVSNAIKYTPEGGRVKINTEVQTEERDAFACIMVKDSGLGIPEEDLPHIFERFYRVNNEEHSKIEGTGLGLAITKTIVEQHNGFIDVESKVGEGTTFTIKLRIIES